jgi:predicted dehydrogenase
MGGAELLDTGWHGAYRLLALADSRPVEAYAVLGNYLLKQLSGEDTATVVVKFASGLQGLLVTSWAFGGEPGAWHFVVNAEHGAVAGNVNRLVHAPHGFPRGAERAYETTHAESYAREVTHFLDVVLDGAPSQAGWEHAARTLQLIRGAYRSAETNQPVVLPEDPTSL